MPLLRVSRQLVGAPVDHLDGRRGSLCVRGPPECLILLVHRKALQPCEIGTVSGRIADESISHDRLSESSPCAIRCDRGNQTPLRFLGGGRVPQPQGNLWPSAARFLPREPGSEERPAVPGCTTPCPVSSSVIRAHFLHSQPSGLRPTGS